MKTKSEQMTQESEIRTKLWMEFINNYQKVLESQPEKLTRYAERFRDQSLQAR